MRGYRDEGPYGASQEQIAAWEQQRREKAQSAFINCTPHAVTIHTPDGDITFPPSGTVARVEVWPEPMFTVGCAPIEHETYGPVQDMPEPQSGKWFIVSAMVRAAMPHRYDVVSPSGSIRDVAGRIVACSYFAANVSPEWEG